MCLVKQQNRRQIVRVATPQGLGWLSVGLWWAAGILFYFIITSFSRFLVLFFLVSFFYLLKCLHLNSLLSWCCHGSLPVPLGQGEWVPGWPLVLWVKPEWAQCPQLSWGLPRDVVTGAPGDRKVSDQSFWTWKMPDITSSKACKSKCTLLMKCQISTACTALICLPVYAWQQTNYVMEYYSFVKNTLCTMLDFFPQYLSMTNLLSIRTVTITPLCHDGILLPYSEKNANQNSVSKMLNPFHMYTLTPSKHIYRLCSTWKSLEQFLSVLMEF